MRWLLLLMLVACNSKAKDKPKPGSGSVIAQSDWRVPVGWRTEVIPFPLEFAPSIKHTGVEELRFPPGFFKPDAPDYWSYAFIWRTTDAADLDAKALADELTLYFRGLIVSVDEKKQQVKPEDREKIVATATPNGAQFKLTAHVYDAFGDGRAIDLVGWAERRKCGTGALWVFVYAPEKSMVRAALDDLAHSAACTK